MANQNKNTLHALQGNTAALLLSLFVLFPNAIHIHLVNEGIILNALNISAQKMHTALLVKPLSCHVAASCSSIDYMHIRLLASSLGPQGRYRIITTNTKTIPTSADCFSVRAP
ncbi:hypothetical protein F4808DRAFT_425949 [Astrocystis sublimbata]|nr:hypothetical protein F4808DRAFT_425949 [Astrocystis sublimbata]